MKWTLPLKNELKADLYGVNCNYLSIKKKYSIYFNSTIGSDSFPTKYVFE